MSHMAYIQKDGPPQGLGMDMCGQGRVSRPNTLAKVVATVCPNSGNTAQPQCLEMPRVQMSPASPDEPSMFKFPEWSLGDWESPFFDIRRQGSDAG